MVTSLFVVSTHCICTLHSLHPSLCLRYMCTHTHTHVNCLIYYIRMKQCAFIIPSNIARLHNSYHNQPPYSLRMFPFSSTQQKVTELPKLQTDLIITLSVKRLYKRTRSWDRHNTYMDVTFFALAQLSPPANAQDFEYKCRTSLMFSLRTLNYTPWFLLTRVHNLII